MLTSHRFVLTSRRVLPWHGRCVHGFRQINPVRLLAFALVLSLCNGPPFPAFADSGGTGAKAPAVRTARGWAAMSGGDLKSTLDGWSRAAAGMQEFDLLCAGPGIEHSLAPPQHPQTNGMAECFNGRIEDVLESPHFRSGEELETTLHRSVVLYNQQHNQQLPQPALGSRTASGDEGMAQPEARVVQEATQPPCGM